MTLRLKANLLLLLLFVTSTAGAQTQKQTSEQPPLAQSYWLWLEEDATPLTIPLPEGYGVVQNPDSDTAIISAPWNEFFNVVVAGYVQTEPSPIDSEVRMTAELDAFFAAIPSLEIVSRKQWMDPKGPRASFEIWEGTKPKRRVFSNLVLPAGGQLLVIATSGEESSLPDQQLFQELLLKEINAQ